MCNPSPAPVNSTNPAARSPGIGIPNPAVPNASASPAEDYRQGMAWTTSPYYKGPTPQQAAPPVAASTPAAPSNSMAWSTSPQGGAGGIGGSPAPVTTYPQPQAPADTITAQTRPMEYNAGIVAQPQPAPQPPITRPPHAYDPNEALKGQTKPLEVVNGTTLPWPTPSGSGPIISPPGTTMDQSPASRVSSALLRRYQRPVY